MSKCLFLPPLLHPLETLTSYQAPTETVIPKTRNSTTVPSTNARERKMSIFVAWEDGQSSASGGGILPCKWQVFHCSLIPITVTQQRPSPGCHSFARGSLKLQCYSQEASNYPGSSLGQAVLSNLPLNFI